MGKPAARITDMHVCPKRTGKIPHVGGPIAAGSPDVLIGGLPAARVGDMAVCVGSPDKIAAGSSGMLINGKQAARMGDATAHGGKIVGGCPTVLIGDGGGGGGSAPVKTADTGSDVGAGGFIAAQQAQAQTLANAAKAGKRYCEICVR